MEIKDLATAVELRAEMADVRGGGRQFNLGNINIHDVWSSNYSDIYNGDVNANTNVYADRSSGSSLSNIGAVVTYAPSNTVSQTSGNAFDIYSTFSNLNLS